MTDTASSPPASAMPVPGARLQRQALRARAFALASRGVGRLQAWIDGLLPPPMRVLQLGTAFWRSRALYVAVRLDLATALGDERLTTAELAARVGAHPDACHRLLRFLAALGLFAFDRDGRVAQTPASQTLRGDRPGSVRHVVLMHNSPEMTQPWLEALEDGVRTGRVPFERVHGRPLYAHMDAHPAFDALFAQAMDEVGALVGADAFATALDWGRFQRVIDLGGGKGAKSATLLQHHPALHALVMDRPSVIAQARAWWQQPPRQAWAARVEFQAGDLLHDPLPAATGPTDAYLLTAVLHGCDDPTAIDLLRRVRVAAARSGACAILMEVIVPDHDADPATTSFDLQMLMATRGRERTRREWAVLAQAAGWRVREVVAMASIGGMIVLDGV